MPKPLTQLLPVDGNQPPTAQHLALAREVLLRGGVVALPTETVYGLGVLPDVPGSLDQLYRAKRRPPEKAIARMPPSASWCAEHGLLNQPAARRLAEAYWPGPLTLVLPADEGTVGYRVPDHAFTLGLLAALDTCLAVTSANLSGEDPLPDGKAIRAAMEGEVELVFDAGPSPSSQPSTVVHVDASGLTVLREGVLTVEEIRASAGTSSGSVTSGGQAGRDQAD